MAVNACDCGQGGSNTGHPNCVTLPSVGSKYIIVQTVADDGTKNRIDSSVDVLDAAFFAAKYNEPDASKRWFPLGTVENLSDLRDEPIVETFNSGRTRFIQEGQSKVSFLQPDFGAKWLGKAQSFMCGEYSVYEVDADGTLEGTKTVESGITYLEPTPLQKDSFYPRLIKATDTTGSAIQIQFEYDKSVNDANYCYVVKADMDNHNLLKDKGLLDINLAASNEATTGVTITVTTDYGDIYSPDYVEGLVVGDFAAAEVLPAPGAIAITSATESSPGVYDLVYTAPQTAADTQTVTVTKTGFAITTSPIYTTP